MKKLITTNILAAIILLFAGCACCKKAKSENVSFYKVPLVCGAAPEIGCGSRAKPVLLEMEKNPSIKEAWLNRAGTVYAIVWNTEDQTEKIAKPIFEKYKITYTALNNKEANNELINFRKENLWYHGAEVDKLSIEEAGVIANDAVTWALSEKLLNQKEADTIKIEMENYFKKELVKVRTTEELYGKVATDNFKKSLTDVAAKYIGNERAEKISKLYLEKLSNKKKNTKSCCDKKQEKESCCKKK